MNGQGKGKRASFSKSGTFRPNASAMCFDQVPGNRQANATAAARLARARLIYPIEAREEMRKLLCGDANPIIYYRYHGFIPL